MDKKNVGAQGADQATEVQELNELQLGLVGGGVDGTHNGPDLGSDGTHN